MPSSSKGTCNPYRGTMPLMRSLRDDSGVYCVSAFEQSPLQWAHYADGQRGLTIHFDSTYSMFRECWQVNYLSSFPAVEVMAQWSEGALRKFLSEFMFVKHEDWDYEHEWRMSLPIFAVARKPGKEHDPDLNVDIEPPFVTCDPRAIAGVTFGAKMPTHVRDELRSAHGRRPNRH